ncbi:MAG: trypsin-like peptidase domain-containing protein [Lachnospiraceae bacterium]|nr:trypsin-like peptidase domain-containing protein [Lachnospiraceae bacterium]
MYDRENTDKNTAGRFSGYGSSSINAGSTGTNYANTGSTDDSRYRSMDMGGTTYSSMGTVENNKKKKKKSGGHFFRRLIATVFLGVLFGGVAAGSFYGVAKYTDVFAEIRDAMGVNDAAVSGSGQIAQTPVVPETKETTESKAPSNPGRDRVQHTENITAVVSDVSGVVGEVMPSVVSIVNKYTETANFWGQTYSQEQEASGSGIIVGENDTELLLVTNYHVVADAETLEVTFVDESVGEAQIKGTDSAMDLAVIAIPLESLSDATKNAIAVATLGDSDDLSVGEPAIAIGNALGYGQSVTTGVISALNREIGVETDAEGNPTATETFIQTDAAINPGNSGGALLNIQGEVIGINSNKIGGTTIEGMGYAIPISAAKPIISDLMLKETKSKVTEEQKGYLGISGQTVSEEAIQSYNMPAGVYIAQVYDGTGAAEAGMQTGDIITSLDGAEVTSMEDLQKQLEYYAAGTTVQVTIERAEAGGYQSSKLTVTLGAQE